MLGALAAMSSLKRVKDEGTHCLRFEISSENAVDTTLNSFLETKLMGPLLAISGLECRARDFFFASQVALAISGTRTCDSIH